MNLLVHNWNARKHQTRQKKFHSAAIRIKLRPPPPRKMSLNHAWREKFLNYCEQNCSAQIALTSPSVCFQKKCCLCWIRKNTDVPNWNPRHLVEIRGSPKMQLVCCKIHIHVFTVWRMKFQDECECGSLFQFSPPWFSQRQWILSRVLIPVLISPSRSRMESSWSDGGINAVPSSTTQEKTYTNQSHTNVQQITFSFCPFYRKRIYDSEFLWTAAKTQFFHHDGGQMRCDQF